MKALLQASSSLLFSSQSKIPGGYSTGEMFMSETAHPPPHR